ncbi:MAG: S-methyl-5'-thioadenosine phosphorylase [Kiritimatiellae bacterium]|nr:S-methyl-5'-thioadenosine phosphorylase [Kiritimatiellia bacterium]
MKLGIIGGSGLYELDALENKDERLIETPFGEPSDAYICGIINDVEVFFLPRHGRGHRLMPSEINHRANIFGFKSLGVERIISVSAVGSLKEELRPRDVVLPDQYFDRTKGSREHTFFGEGVVAHVSFADPACAELRSIIATAAEKVVAAKGTDFDVRINNGGTYVNMEGPAFSTRAESNVYRQHGFDIIGMTSLPEAKLCREAEICYQAMSMVTDYDCWRETEGAVTVDMVIAHLTANTALAKEIIVNFCGMIFSERKCGCGNALSNALLTQKDAVSEHARERLAVILGKYL